MAWTGALADKGDDNFQRRWFGTYMAVASCTTHWTGSPRSWTASGGRGLAVNQDLRWAIIGRLNRFAYPGAADARRRKHHPGPSACPA